MNSQPAWNQPARLDSQAQENLRFIRETMTRSVQFTAVPGWGMVGAGLTSVLAYFVATRQSTASSELLVWLGEAVVAATLLSLATFRKAQREGLFFRHAVTRRFLFNLTPPLVTGAVLTAALWRVEQLETIPGMWLLLYGTAVLTGGAFSVKPIPSMGLAFGLFGCLALITAPDFQQEWLLAGFGLLHLIFGTYLVRNYGG